MSKNGLEKSWMFIAPDVRRRSANVSRRGNSYPFEMCARRAQDRFVGGSALSRHEGGVGYGEPTLFLWNVPHFFLYVIK